MVILRAHLIRTIHYREKKVDGEDGRTPDAELSRCHQDIEEIDVECEMESDISAIGQNKDPLVTTYEWNWIAQRDIDSAGRLNLTKTDKWEIASDTHGVGCPVRLVGTLAPLGEVD